VRLLSVGLNQLAIISAHGLAALRARRMHRITFERGDEGADILHALRIEPAPFHPAPDGEEVGFGLVGALELVAAFVAVDVELHLGREPIDLLVVRITKPGKAPPQLSKLGFSTVGRLPQLTDLPSIFSEPQAKNLRLGPPSFMYC
jgi:hypothetical protein